jgi:maltose alpha-D-glucosyltransferase/alpha-amylase
VLVFIRRKEEEIILVAANLSRFVNYAELDLSAYKGMVPVELFGHTRFPAIGELPYFLTLGPHAFYWFKLEAPQLHQTGAAVETFEPAKLEVSGSWEQILEAKPRAALEGTLPAYFLACRWFGGKAQQIRSVKNIDVIPFSADSVKALFTTWEVQYISAHPETYLMALAYASGRRAFELRQASPQSVIAQLKVKEQRRETDEGILYDAIYDPTFSKALITAIERGRRFKGPSAELAGEPSQAFRKILGGTKVALEPSILRREQSNTSVVFGDRAILKFFRRVTEGLNPDLEIGRFLTEKAGFANTPPLAGYFELRKGRGEPTTVGILQGLIAHEGDAWRYTLDGLGHYFEEILSRQPAVGLAALPHESLPGLAQGNIPELAQELIGSYLSSAQLLGQRTGELHMALASEPKDAAFAPEPFTALYRRALYQSLRALADQSLTLLARRLKSLPAEIQSDAEKVLKLEGVIFERFHRMPETKFTALRVRCHGDYHLGQVLFTGKDFVILDFEGEPSRPISERRLKRSPLRDVASMLRSFNYAAVARSKNNDVRPEAAAQLKPWAAYWNLWVSVSFLKGFLAATRDAAFMPATVAEISLMLDIYLLEKAVYELGYELNNRPNWVSVPLEGILELTKPQI